MNEIEFFNLKQIKQNDYKLKKVKPEEMNVGELAYVDNSKNMVKLINDKEFMFIRFDGIETHVDDFKSKYTLQDIKNKILSKLDMNIKYANDRSELVNNLITNNQWIYDLTSDSKIIKKEVKKKTSLLAENQAFDKLMQIISTYITHAKFKDEDDEIKYNSLKEERYNLANKKSKSNEELDRLYELNSIISDYDSKSSVSEQNNNRVELVDDLSYREIRGDYAETTDEKKLEIKRKRHKKHHKFDITFWDNMGYTLDEKIWRNNIINNFEKEILLLEKRLGKRIKDIKEREKHIENLLEEFSKNKIFYTYQNKRYEIDSKRQLKILNDAYKNLKGDFKVAIVKLTDQISFKRLDKTNTKYDWNFDTWYLDENGNEVSISKNILSFINPNTFKGILLNHKDLKEKYQDDFNNDMWAILWDFETMLNEVEFTDEELFVIDGLYHNKNQTEIRHDYYMYFGNELDKDRLSRMINTYIPNKLQTYYINLTDDWIYTYKLFGEFKKCSKCGEIKLISNDRYFGKDPRNKDGYKSICKKCDSYTKNCEK